MKYLSTLLAAIIALTIMYFDDSQPMWNCQKQHSQEVCYHTLNR